MYAISLGPPSGKLTLTAVKVNQAGADARVCMLGREGSLPFEVNEKRQLVIDVSSFRPESAPCEYAYGFKLTGFDLDVQPDAVKKAPKTEMVHD